MGAVGAGRCGSALNECLVFGSVSIALLCSFLLGLGDSCFNTQLYSILGRIYAEESTSAFAIFKFIQVKRRRIRPETFWVFILAAATTRGAG